MQKHLKDFFIPHEGNDYAPHSLQKVAVFCMGILILLSFTLANLQSILWITSDWLVSTILPAVIVELTNEERETYSLSDLRRNATLDAAATFKAQHMAQNEYFAHYAPDGTSPWHWFSVADYDFVHAGENLAIHFSDSDAVVDAWMNSPTHKANIVNGDYTEIGVGTAKGVYEGYQTVYVVQLFGTPALAAPAPVVEVVPEPAVLAAAPDEEVLASSSEDVSTSTPLIASAEEVVTEVDDDEIRLSTDRDPIAVAASSSDTVTDAPAVAKTMTEKEVVVHDDGVSVYSGTVSSSTGAVPATIDTSYDETLPQSTSPVYKMATKPQTVLQVLYGVMGMFVACLLLLSILVEIRRQQPVQIAYSAALMVLMGVLFYAHLIVTSSVIVV